MLVAPIPHLARDAAAGLVGLDLAWLRRLVDGFGRYRVDFAQIAVLSRRWRGFTRARDTYLNDWPRRHGSAGFNEDLVFPYGLVSGTAAVLEVRRAQIGMVLVGRERSSRSFTDGECDLLNGILPILAMGEAIHASTATLATVSAPSLAQPSYPGLTSRAS
ncbi:MAG TPA: hypothetical protein VHN14_07190 [Kofleriaceae bacterium]|nr:hypothetical protein [Kofleriaceae bacterium]